MAETQKNEKGKNDQKALSKTNEKKRTAEVATLNNETKKEKKKQHCETENTSFADFDLDTRLLRALAKLGFDKPTLIQEKAIPIALQGKDILARARTGSGKTAAYSLPVLQNILATKEAASADSPVEAATRSLVLVPTRELAEQVTSYLNGLLSYCAKAIKVTNVAANIPVQLQKPLLAELPDVVVSTPARALTHLESGSLSLAHLQTLVIDEADLVLSYGYEDDVKKIALSHLPKIYQSVLMSATVTKDVEGLKSLLLKSPAILRLEEEKNQPDLLTQYSVMTSEKDKFLLTYVILKLKLIRGKIIIFVNNIERCYRLKLILEQYSIRSCVLNSELPLNSRYHIVQEFNKGIYDYIIATDEASLQGIEETDEEDDDEEEKQNDKKTDGKSEPAVAADDEQTETTTKEEPSTKPTAAGKRLRRQRQDKEYGVSRGVDFRGVACVLNFDFPQTARAYTHRVGRTARGGQRGMALSFVVPENDTSSLAATVAKIEEAQPEEDVDVDDDDDEEEEAKKKKKEMMLKAAKKKLTAKKSKEEKLLEKVERRMAEERGVGGGAEETNGNAVIKPYVFDMRQVEGFRYRMEDAMRAVTRAAVRESRVKELKAEILNSEKLKAHFEDKPRDLAFLRHDRALHPTRVQSHLKHIPTYMMPKLAAASTTIAPVNNESASQIGRVNFHNNKKKSRRPVSGGGAQNKRKKSDPLKNFSSAASKKRKT